MSMESSAVSRAMSLSSVAFQGTLLNKQRELSVAQEQLASGLRINRASDDAAGYARARQFEQLQNRYDQYERTMSVARSWIDHTQANLEGLSNLFSEAYQSSVGAANETLDQGERDAIATLIDTLKESTIDLLNEQVDDEYLYAGTRSTVKPFAVDPIDPTADGAGVVYYGNDQPRPRAIGPETTLDVAVSGTQVFNVDRDGDGTADYTLTEALQNLSDALRANDTVAIAQNVEVVKGAMDHIVELAAEVGTKGNKLTLAENQLIDAGVTVAQHRSTIEDADFAETIITLQKAQADLQNSLQVASRVLDLSLLNYI
ncbi:MAG: flagellin [Rhodothermales bacterium]